MKKMLMCIGGYVVGSFALIGLKFCIERMRENV